MARKITMFELHFDDIRFGGAGTRSSVDEDESASVETPAKASDDSGRSLGRRVLALVVTSVAVSYVASRIARRFADEGVETDIELEEVADTDEAAAQ